MSALTWGLTICIPSRARAEIVPGAVRVLPPGIPKLVVRAGEAEAYRRANPGVEVWTPPDTVVGINQTRQWILETVSTEAVFMMDDDVAEVVCLAGQQPRPLDPWATYNLIAVGAMVAKELGTSLFGYLSRPDSRLLANQNPLAFGGWIAGFAIGIVGRRYAFDPSVGTKDDIDYSLQVLQGDRLVFRDRRFAFVTLPTFRTPGGASTARSAVIVEADSRRIKEKWGDLVDIMHHDGEARKSYGAGNDPGHTNVRISRHGFKNPRRRQTGRLV